MKSEKERLQELDNEPFYLKLFSGTKMPIAPNFTEIVMFNDVFFIETEEGRKENINDIAIIKSVKELIWANIENFEFMEKSIGDAVRSSHNHNISFKINFTSFSINRNTLNEEAQKLYNVIENDLMDIINVDQYI